MFLETFKERFRVVDFCRNFRKHGLSLGVIFVKPVTDITGLFPKGSQKVICEKSSQKLQGTFTEGHSF